MKTKTELVWSNCFFAILYLILRNKTKKVIAVTCHSKLAPHHYVVQTWNDNYLSFSHALPHEKNRFAPYWFVGQYKCFSYTKAAKALEEQNREVKFSINPYVFLILALLVYIILFIPWCVIWGMYVPFNHIKDTIHAIRKRK